MYSQYHLLKNQAKSRLLATHQLGCRHAKLVERIAKVDRIRMLRQVSLKPRRDGILSVLLVIFRFAGHISLTTVGIFWF